MPISHESMMTNKVIEVAWNFALKAVFLYVNNLLDICISYSILSVHVWSEGGRMYTYKYYA